MLKEAAMNTEVDGENIACMNVFSYKLLNVQIYLSFTVKIWTNEATLTKIIQVVNTLSWIQCKHLIRD